MLGKNHTCVEINTDFHNFHVCGKNQTCVGITNDYLNYHVCGFYHTCVDFTKYLRHVQVFGKNHTCVGKYKHVCVFQNTGWYNLNGLTYNRNKNTCGTLRRLVNIEGGCVSSAIRSSATPYFVSFATSFLYLLPPHICIICHTIFCIICHTILKN